jgi:transposase
MAIRNYDPNQRMLMWMSPEEVLPSEHLCFVVDEIVESLDVRNTREHYEGAGAPAYDCRLQLKVLFYSYAEGITSSRKIGKQCYENVAYHYLTRMQFPDFRTISDFRKNHRAEIRGYFQQLVRRCRKMGIVKLGHVSIDSVKMQADAAAGRKKDKALLQEELKKLDEYLEKTDRADEEEDGKYGNDKTGEELPDDIKDHEQRKEKLRKALRELEEEGLKDVNLTDPECRWVKDRGRLVPGYSCQTAADEENQVIVGYTVVKDPGDSAYLEAVLDEIKEATGDDPDEISADSAYHSNDNVVMVGGRGIKGYIPDKLQAEQINKKCKKLEMSEYHVDHFTYDSQQDCLICPQGKRLKAVKRRTRRGKKTTIYQGAECKSCPVRDQCTKNRHGVRTVEIDYSYFPSKEMRRRVASEEGRKAYEKRKTIIEPPFGNLKHNLGIRRFRVRGRDKVDAEYGLMCIGHNLKKIWNATLRGLKPAYAIA